MSPRWIRAAVQRRAPSPTCTESTTIATPPMKRCLTGSRHARTDVTSKSFTGKHILGAILFEKTMDRTFDGQPAADYLWEKNILPILKVDKGLADAADGVRLMKPIPDLDELLERAKEAHIFGTRCAR